MIIKHLSISENKLSCFENHMYPTVKSLGAIVIVKNF